MAQSSLHVMEFSGMVKLPHNLDLQSPNLSSEWKFWKQSFEDYLITTGQDNAADKVRLSLLRNMMGPDAARILSTLPLSEEDSLKYDKVMGAIEDYANPRTNIVFDRFMFNARVQEEGETFDHFLTECRRLLKTCNYSDSKGETIENQLLRDKIVHGVRDKSVQEGLLRQDDLTLDKTIKYCQASEQSKKQVEKLSTGFQEVLAIRPRQNKGESSKGNQRNSDEAYDCSRCQTKHTVRNCPAFGKKCKRCGLKNHFAVSCKVKNIKSMVSEQASSKSSDSDSSLSMLTKLPKVNVKLIL